MPSWFNRRTELPVPPPEPPPSAAARKAKEQGWLESIRSRSKSGGSGRSGAGGGIGSVPSSPQEVVITKNGSPKSPSRPIGNILNRSRSRLGLFGGGGGDATSLASSSKLSPPPSPASRPDSSAWTPPPSTRSRGFLRTPSRSRGVSEFGENQPLSPSPWKVRTSKGTLSSKSLASSTVTAAKTSNGKGLDVEMATKSLAQRLEELATANEDGLLDDDEYRVLRQGVFATSGAGEEALVADEPRRGGLLDRQKRLGSSRTSLAPSPMPKDRGRLSSSRTPSIRPSIRSTRSAGSFLSTLFKRGSKVASPDEQWEDGAPASPRASFSSPPRPASAYSVRTQTSMRSNASTMARRRGARGLVVDADVPPLPENLAPRDHVPLRSRSIRVRPELHANGSSTASVRSGKSSSGPQRAAHSSSASVFSAATDTSASRASNPGTSVYSRSSRIAALNDYSVADDHLGSSEASAADLRREIAELEEECSRLLETFRELERSVVAKARAVPASSPTAALPEDTDGRSDDGIGPRRRPTSFLAPLPPAEAFEARRSPRMGTTRRLKRRASSGGPPSSPKGQSSFEASVDSPKPSVLAPSSPLPVVATPTLSGDEGDEQEAALRKEVESILARRRAVEEKYGKRLEYLRAKLKGAMIRERLPR